MVDEWRRPMSAAPPVGGQVSHVLYCFSPDGLERAVSFWRGFGVEFDEVALPGVPLRVFYSRASGLEVIAPTDGTPSAYNTFLSATRGAGGMYGVVYRVADLDAAVAQAEASGTRVERRISYTGRAPWSEQYELLEEAILEDYAGMRVVLAQIELHEPSPDGTSNA